MAEYIIQKAVEPSKVVKSRRLRLEDMAVMYEAQPKYDGCCAVIRVDDGEAFSRTGEPNKALGGIIRELRTFPQLAGTVVIGEAWHPELPFNEISGAFRRFTESNRLILVIHDVIPKAEFHRGFDATPYRVRMGLTRGVCSPRVRVTNRMEPGSYGDPQTVCNALVDHGGFDGLILRDPEGTWTRGSGTTGEIIKIKRKLSFDLRVVGTWPGEGRHEGRIGSLIVDFRGKTLRVGTGLSDADRELDDWIGQIVEVEAMDYSSDGLLREPRLKGRRYDKLEPDT